jgi:large repetitive protein
MTDPIFSAPVTNPFGLTDVGYFATPTFADIDGDGDLDAFVGNDRGNTLFYYRNTGSASNPQFDVSSTNPFGLTNVGAFAKPTFADIDGDGDLDAFVGEEYGNTLFYRNTGSATNPQFAASSTNPFGLTDVGFFAAPTLADIDGDGDLDAFVGNNVGNTLFYRNTGSATNPQFDAPSANPFGLTDVGYSAAPTFADIDGDGDLDAFVGNDIGNTLFYRNTGSASNPQFAASSTNPFGLTDVGYSATPTFADIDNDGDLDAFVGNRGGNTLFYKDSFNQPPTAVNDAVSTNENTLLNGNVLAANPTTADSDPNGDTLTVTGATIGGTAITLGQATALGNGLLTVNADGTFSFDPTNGTTTLTDGYDYLAQDATAQVSFGYTISDGKGGTSNATATITINGVNDAPTLTGTQATLAAGTEDTNYTITAASLLQGFTDVDSSDTLSVSNLTANNGALVNNNNGTYTFTPNANYNGVVNLTYGVTDGTVTLAGQTRSFSVTAVNDAATISGIATASVTEDATTPNLTANGTLTVADVDAGENQFRTTVTPANGNLGSLTITDAGAYTYSVDNGLVQSLGAGQTKIETFTVKSVDGTASQDISVTINGVNDAPTLTGTQATLVAGSEDTAYTITAASLLQGFTDVDSSDTLSVSNLTANNGALVNNNNGTYTFTPNTNYNGIVNLTYDVTDGTVTLAGQTRNFSVTAVNDAPVAVNDTTTAFQNTALTIATSSLLANDSDVDSPASSLRITGVSGATNGTVALNNNGTPTNFADDFITFTPNTGFSGNASFNYTLSDGSLTSTATVQVVVGKNINGGNDNDNLTGTSGNDVINGLNGQDIIFGLAGNDRLDGGNGNDKLYGGAGSDTLLGGNGQDQLWGDAGDDLLTGGLGPDTFVLGNNLGVDTITDLSLDQGDKIGLLGGLTFNQLSFSGNQILAGSEVLAVVNGLNTNTLTAANFVSVSESVI